MKVKITRPDGTVIEAEGTPEEIERLVAAPVPQPFSWLIPQAVPYFQPLPFPAPLPDYPSWPDVGWPYGTWCSSGRISDLL